MAGKHIPIPLDEIPPDDFSQDTTIQEKVINYDEEWSDKEVGHVSPVEVVQAQIAEKVARKASVPVSVPSKAEAGIPVTEVSPTLDQQIKSSSKAASSAERKRRWRKNHGDEARRKEREYLKNWRKERNGTNDC